MDASAENYQLKWRAFSSNLHSCVAASMSLREFTDVSLATMDGYQMAAHRFILSACSQYLQDILKIHCNANTSSFCPILIILPAEISSRSLKVLMEYMYSGKATVSKDILENVLRGGDLLKIKGLWRANKDDIDHSIKVIPTETLQQIPQHTQDSVNISTKKIPKKGIRYHSVITNRDTFLNNTTSSSFTKQTDVESRKHNESHANSTKVVPTSMHPKAVQPVNNVETDEELQTKLVVKEEPIEWDEMSEQETEEFHSGELYLRTSTADTTNEMIIKPEIIFDDDADNDDNVLETIITSNIDVVNIPLQPLDTLGEIVCTTSAGKKLTLADEAHDDSSSQAGELYTPLTCELCAETFTLPKDWVKHVQTHTDMMPAKRKRRGRNSSEDESSNTFPPLQCDLCQTYYLTPAEWVQHIERSHTVTELRFSNMDKSNETESGKAPVKTREYLRKPNSLEIMPALVSTLEQLKECSVCKKTFPSHASMMIHSRTHTGERPYNCDYCYRGFNVKSNLLRHLRTLHDKIINSSEIESKDIY